MKLCRIHKYLDQLKEFWESLEKSPEDPSLYNLRIVVIAVTFSIMILTRPQKINIVYEL